MIKTFLKISLYFFTYSFAAQTPLGDIDTYISRLRRVLPSETMSYIFNVCDGLRDFKEIQLDSGTYYFVNKTHIAVCPVKALEGELSVGVGVVYGDLKSILRGWMETKNKFSRCHGALSEINFHRSCMVDSGIAMGLYEREPFLSACTPNACGPARGRPRERLLIRFSASQQPVDPVSSVKEKSTEPRVDQPKIDHTKILPLDTVTALVKDHAYMERPISPIPTKSVETGIAAIVKELNSEQIAAIDQKYAGTGMTFAEKYEAARKDGLFEEILSRKRSVSRSPSRPKSAGKYSVSQPYGREKGFEGVAVSRASSPSPSRMRPLKVVFKTKKVQRAYTQFFGHEENSAARTHFYEFVHTVSTVGLLDYVNRSAAFHSYPGAFKLSLGGKARLLYYRGEDDLIVLIGNPAHYGD